MNNENQALNSHQVPSLICLGFMDSLEQTWDSLDSLEPIELKKGYGTPSDIELNSTDGIETNLSQELTLGPIRVSI